MNELLPVLERYGTALLFLFVLVEQTGLPLPAAPALLAAGALAGFGKLSFAAALLAAATATTLADSLWYHLGRSRGQWILRLLCRLSLEPANCVRRTHHWFGRYGEKALLVAKFIPGFGTASVALSGMTRMPWPRFLLWDSAGSLLWAGCYMALGWLFRNQLELVVLRLEQTGTGLAWTLAGLVVLGSALKFWGRRRFLRQLREARITPEELWEKLGRGENVVIVDLRRSAEWGDSGATVVRGAIRIAPEELEARHQEIPRDREIILYCT